jgi:excisionase family DNA binding protein
MMPQKSLAMRISKARNLDGGAPAAVSLMEAAARLRVGRSKMQELVRDKKIRSVKIGKMLRIPVNAIDEYLAELESAK